MFKWCQAEQPWWVVLFIFQHERLINECLKGLFSSNAFIQIFKMTWISVVKKLVQNIVRFGRQSVQRLCDFIIADLARFPIDHKTLLLKNFDESSWNSRSILWNAFLVNSESLGVAGKHDSSPSYLAGHWLLSVTCDIRINLVGACFPWL